MAMSHISEIMLQLNIACFQAFHANIHQVIKSHWDDRPAKAPWVHVLQPWYGANADSCGASLLCLTWSEPMADGKDLSRARFPQGPCSTLNRLDFDLQFVRIFSISLRLTLQKTNI